MNGPDNKGTHCAPGYRDVADVASSRVEPLCATGIASVLHALCTSSPLYFAFAEYEALCANYASTETAIYRLAVSAGWCSKDPAKENMIDRYWELLHDRAMRADFPLDTPKTARIAKFRRYEP